MTMRTSGLSTPMPKALVATMTRRSPSMKDLLDVLLQPGIEPRMEMRAGPAHVLEEGGDLFGASCVVAQTQRRRRAVAVRKAVLPAAVDQRIFLGRLTGTTS